MTKCGGIYIHIPYCVSKCFYCDFVSYAGAEDTQEKYIAALKKEIEIYAAKHKDFIADTVYFGGGTPSVLREGGISEILTAIKQKFKLTANAEITIEANPKTVTAKKAEEYISAGINRFSIGLQSSEDAVLKASGRPHNYADFLRTVSILREHGAKNISADIILGLPSQTLRGAKKTAENLVKLGVEHISAYGLILEQGTPMFKAVAENKIKVPDEDQSADMYDAVYEIFENAGLRRYEVSNFAREGFCCRHNLNYWHRGEYIGLGVAAHGFIKNRRYENEKSIDAYIVKLKNGSTGKTSEEKISLADAEKEYMMLGLRLENGLDTEKFEEIFLVDFFKKYEKALQKLYNAGCVYFEGRFLKIKPQMFKFLNKIILEFF